MRATTATSGLVLGVAVALGACSGGTTDGTATNNSDLSGDDANKVPGLDVNDVSILFPLRKVGSGALDFEVYPRVSVVAPLFQESLLKQLLDFGSDRGVEMFFDGMKQWRVTALRYDPCAPNPSAAASLCHPQIRLVAQEIRTVPGPGIDDSGMHLIFRAADALPGAADPIIAELRAIQVASRKAGAETVGRALGEHPGLAAEASKQEGPVGNLVKEFIARHCSADRMTDLTFTGTNEGDDSWFFYGGHVTDGVWAAAPVPNLVVKPGDGDNLEIGLLGIGDEQALSPPPIASAASVAPVLNAAPKDISAAKLAALHRIDNPLESTPENTDCGSCHASSRLLRQHAVPFTGKDDEFIDPPGITGFAELELQPADETSVRNFGWLMTKPVVTWLTANSSAAVAARVNQTQGWSNPSTLDCSSPAVRECFAGRAATGGKTAGTAKECLTLCRSK
jgi:hypothetical protein